MQKKEKQREKFKVLDYYPNEYISISALTSFEMCPVSFYLKYYLGVKWPSERATLGSQFQEALNAKYAGKDYTSIINSIKATDRPTAEELIKKANDFDEIVSIDKPYTANFGIGIPVMFVPDLLTKSTVVENKYSTGYYNPTMVQKQKQGTVYYWGVKQLFGFEPKVQYQIFNHKLKTVELVDVQKDSADVADMLNWMIATLARIKRCYESGNWIVQQHSKFKCDLGYACPINGKF